MSGKDGDNLTLYGQPLASRLLLGTALYPSPDILRRAVEAAKPGVLTVSLRRESGSGGSAGQRFWELVKGLGRPHPAQHGRLPHGARSHHDGANGARAVRDGLDQA